MENSIQRGFGTTPKKMPESSTLSSYEEQRFLGKTMTRFFVFAGFTLLITANEKKVLIVLAALKTYSRLVRTSSRVGLEFNDLCQGQYHL